jgi:hypothetical protein
MFGLSLISDMYVYGMTIAERSGAWTFESMAL